MFAKIKSNIILILGGIIGLLFFWVKYLSYRVDAEKSTTEELKEQIEQNEYNHQVEEVNAINKQIHKQAEEKQNEIINNDVVAPSEPYIP